MEYARLNAGKLGLAVALAILLVWIIFALITWLTGGMMMVQMGAEMGIGPEEGMGAGMIGGGMFLMPALFGGLFSAIGSGIMAWLIASIYNRLI